MAYPSSWSHPPRRRTPSTTCSAPPWEGLAEAPMQSARPLEPQGPLRGPSPFLTMHAWSPWVSYSRTMPPL